MTEEASIEFRLRKIDETRNCLLDEIKQNSLMSEKYKKTCKYLNYVEQLFIWVSAVAGCVSISTFTSLVCVPVGITNSAVGIKIFAINAGIKKYKSIINKKRKNYHKIILLGKDKLNTIEVLISKALIDSYINHKRFLSKHFCLQPFLPKDSVSLLFTWFSGSVGWPNGRHWRESFWI